MVKLVLDETNVDVERVTTPSVKTPVPVSPVFPVASTPNIPPGGEPPDISTTWKDAAKLPLLIEQV